MTLGTVAVIGGAGFIGRHVTAALVDRGATPVVLTSSPWNDADIEVRMLDALDTESLRMGLAGCDAVVHLAARAGGIQMQRDVGVFRHNRSITDAVLATCATMPIHDIFIASSQVVYRTSDVPLVEGAPIVSSVDGPSQYAWSKATDEVVSNWWADQTGTRLVTGRFGNVYGPGAPYGSERSTVVHALIDRFCRAPRGSRVLVWGSGNAVRSFTYVVDAGEAVAEILDRGETQSVYNIDSGKAVSIRELASEISRHVDRDLELQFDESKPEGVPFRVGSSERLESLGFTATTQLSDGLASTIADYQTRHSA